MAFILRAYPLGNEGVSMDTRVCRKCLGGTRDVFMRVVCSL